MVEGAGVSESQIELKKMNISHTLPTVRDVSKEKLEEIISTITSSVNNGVNMNNMVNIIVLLMEQVKLFKHLRGLEKKQLVIDLLCHIIDVTDAGAFDALDTVLKAMVPNIIDTFVDVEKGKLIFTTKKVKGCFACCFPSK
tara:strand:- start:312 stop:734 length:423 start_codon:yes stop_codon:yes gene_type:complete